MSAMYDIWITLYRIGGELLMKCQVSFTQEFQSSFS